MARMFGLYRAKGRNGGRDLVCYGNGEVDFITSRTAYEATGLRPVYADLPWRRPLDDLYNGLERHIASS